MLYAIGEIILVVIGILIALQLNTWNEHKKNDQIEINYLKGILTNLDQDILELEYLKKEDSVQLYAYTEILKPFIFPGYKIYDRTFLFALNDAQYTRRFKGSSIVFEDMKSSGKINFINSDILRFSILWYYNQSNYLISDSEFMFNSITDLKIVFAKHLDMNSLIEGNFFKKPLSAELDPLDLSFFKLDKNNSSVKEFANKVSLMKAHSVLGKGGYDILLIESKVLKNKILDYFSSKNIVLDNTVSEATLQAIKEGNIKYLQENISKESLSNCFYQGFEYQNYLVISISLKSLKSLTYFVNQGADLEGVCAKKTPLMYAVKYGEFEMVKYLLNNGANINAVNQEKTVLSYAVRYKYPEIEKYLKEFISKNRK